MGNKRGDADYFRRRFKLERERRGWSQADVSKMLAEKRIGISTTAVAKLEAGTRDVKIDEAAAIADIFDVSLDWLLGRTSGESDKSHAMTALVSEATRLIPAVAEMTERIRQAYDDMQNEFGFIEWARSFPDVQQWLLWLNGGTTAENMRAGLMWAGRDRIMEHLHEVVAELAAITHYRNAPIEDLVVHEGNTHRIEALAAQSDPRLAEAIKTFNVTAEKAR